MYDKLNLVLLNCIVPISLLLNASFQVLSSTGRYLSRSELFTSIFQFFGKVVQIEIKKRN